MNPNHPRNNEFHEEIKMMQPFMQGPYKALREKGWSREECIKIMHTALRVALADEATKRGGIDNDLY